MTQPASDQTESIFTTRILENEFRICTLECLIETLFNDNPELNVKKTALEDARQRAIKILQEKYPQAGINLGQ